MHVQAGITALSNANFKSGIYSQQDLVALASDSSNTKKPKDGYILFWKLRARLSMS